jgi:serine/threonine-protein kinase
MTQTTSNGETIGRFTIIEELGRGGMAVVYKAVQRDLERVVALKVLPPELSRDNSYIARFRQEARSAAQLEHPHIVPIYEIGEAEGAHFIAMKFIPGQTLKELIQQEEAMGLDRIVELLTPIAAALDYAHRHGVIHRDIKPSNMMLTGDGWMYLTDFGLAKGATVSDGLTRTGTVMGTPEYMSPEQAQGMVEVGPASDIYALGVVCYEMLTGDYPFQAETPLGMLAARLVQAPRPPRQLRPALSLDVEAVVMRALARDPQHRYASAGAFVEALRSNAGLPEAAPISPARGTPALGRTIAAAQQLAPLNMPAPPRTQERNPFAPANIAAPTQLSKASSDQPPASPQVAAVAAERPGPNWAKIIGIGLIVLGLLGGIGSIVSTVVGDRIEQAIDEGDNFPPEVIRDLGITAGNVALEEGEYDAAIEVFQGLVDEGVADANVYTRLGDAYVMRGDVQGDDDDAEEDYERAVAAYEEALNSGRTVAALGGLGWAHSSLGDYEEALSHFEEAVAFTPDDAELHNGIAYSHLNLQDYDAAEAAFARAIELDPEYDNAYYGLGQTLEELERDDEARAAYDQALRINPDNDDADDALERLAND